MRALGRGVFAGNVPQRPRSARPRGTRSSPGIRPRTAGAAPHVPPKTPLPARAPSLISAEPEPGAAQLDQGKIVASGFLVTSRDGAKALELVKEALNQIALPVQRPVELMLLPALWLGMNHRLFAEVPHRLYEFVRVVSGVADQGLAVRMSEQIWRGDQLVPLPRRQCDVERPSLRVDDGMELGRKTSSRVSQSIVFDPPFPPAASWCARTTEASTIEPVSSTSSCSSRKIAAQ